MLLGWPIFPEALCLSFRSAATASACIITRRHGEKKEFLDHSPIYAGRLLKPCRGHIMVKKDGKFNLKFILAQQHVDHSM